MMPETLEVFGVDELLARRRCRRLGWWRLQGLAHDLHEPDPLRELLPTPWPALPPGWPGSARSWAKALLEPDLEWGLYGICDWLLDLDGTPAVVLLGDPVPRLRERGRILLALLAHRGHPDSRLYRQPWPHGRLPEIWLGAWAPVVPWPVEPLPPGKLAEQIALARADLEALGPPPATQPMARCWDCPGLPFCGDRL